MRERGREKQPRHALADQFETAKRMVNYRQEISKLALP